MITKIYYCLNCHRNGNQGFCGNNRNKPLYYYMEIEKLLANKTLDVNTLADLMNKKRENLSKQFFKYYGIRPIRFIENMKLEQAINLLINKNLIIYTIAVDVGYASDRDLDRVFQKRFNNTPGEIRKIILNSGCIERKIQEYIYLIWNDEKIVTT
jgi:AraC-like DNA-binding protein